MSTCMPKASATSSWMSVFSSTRSSFPPPSCPTMRARYPARSMRWTISSVLVTAASKSTLPLPIAKLMSEDRTPLWRATVRATISAHDGHVRPSTVRKTVTRPRAGGAAIAPPCMCAWSTSVALGPYLGVDPRRQVGRLHVLELGERLRLGERGVVVLLQRLPAAPLAQQHDARGGRVVDGIERARRHEAVFVGQQRLEVR